MEKKTSQYTPAIEKSVNWISEKITSGAYKSGDTLPTIRHLAFECGVSTVTINKAIIFLKLKGYIAGDRQKRSVVIGAHGGTIYKSDDSLVTHRNLPPSSSQRIENELHKNIILGDFLFSKQLPHLKELQNRFHVSHRTIRLVLQKLCAKGLLEIDGRWYRVKEQRSHKANARIILLGFVFNKASSLIMGLHDSLICSQLQTECRKNNLTLDEVGIVIGTSNDLCELKNGKKFTFDTDIIGCIVLLNQISENWEYIFQTIRSLNVPVSVIDEFGDWSVTQAFPTSGRVRVFSFSTGALAAKEITRALLFKGHRGFAFISPFQNTGWSKMRSEAIQEELAPAGSEVVFRSVEFDIKTKIADLENGRLAHTIHARISDLLNMFPKMAKEAYAHMFNPETWNGLMIESAAEDLLRMGMMSLIENRDITAWVVVNDTTALVAKEFLKTKKIAVPEQISIVSFDNTAVALYTHSASYDFNYTAYVSAIISHCMSVYDPRKLFPAERVELSGTIVERSSMGFAPLKK